MPRNLPCEVLGTGPEDVTGRENLKSGSRAWLRGMLREARLAG